MSGEELKEIRKTLGLNQTELAEKVGIKLRTLQYWEKNERQIPETTAFFVKNLLKNASNAYNISAENSNNENQIAELEVLLAKVLDRIKELESQKDPNSIFLIKKTIKYKYEIQDDLDFLRSS